MLLYTILLIEILLLFFFSRIVSNLLSQTLYFVFKSQKIAIYFFAFLYFPGVLLHELSHWLMAQLLFVRTGRIEFFPVLTGNQLKLGSVAVAQTDPIRRVLIGVAPFFFGTIVIILLLFCYQTFTVLPQGIKAFLVGYGIFEVGNTMFSSRKDLEGTIELLLTMGILAVLLYFIGVRIPSDWIAVFQSEEILILLQKSLIFFAIPLGIDIVAIAILWVTLRLLK